MKTITNLVSTGMAVLFCTMGTAQIKNAKTQTVTIQGNCGMCQSTIEKAGTKKKVSTVTWNKDTKVATLIFDTIKTSEAEILKRIALSGYDNDKYLAPDDVYSKLHSCCQYERTGKPIGKTEAKTEQKHNHEQSAPAKEKVGALAPVIEAYFSLKDALVKTDANAASLKAKDLLNAITAVKMETLKTAEHNVWMEKLKDLKSGAEQISQTKAIEKQRSVFAGLSTNMYELIKVSKHTTPVYYQNCPMYNDGKGANWLSKESTIKNPYYGSQMMSCGKTTETIK